MGASASSASASAAAGSKLLAVLQCGANLVCQDECEYNQQYNAFPAGDGQVGCDGAQQQHSRENGQRPVTAEQRFIHHKRADSGGQTSHHQQIKNVRADNIADRNLVWHRAEPR